MGLSPEKVKSTLELSPMGCLCGPAILLCPHLWTVAFNEQSITSAEGMTPVVFTEMLQAAVQASIPPDTGQPIKSWTSHVFRRGSAVDILQASGVKAMLRHGEWASETSAHAYASLDEIDSEKLRISCTALVDISDDDC